MAGILGFTWSGRSALAGAIGIGLLLAGCGRTSRSSGENDRIHPTYDARTGRLKEITFDRNDDGKVDAWLFMDGNHAVRAELDENYDGKVDRREFYSDATEGQTPPSQVATRLELPRNTLVRAEQSTNDDGRMNRVETYQRGQLATVEEDTTGDGRVDKWETYRAGVLRELQLDTRGLGRPDRRVLYPEDGGPSTLEVDTKGDGHFTKVTPQQ
jgi:hypothetical protein